MLICDRFLSFSAFEMMAAFALKTGHLQTAGL